MGQLFGVACKLAAEDAKQLIQNGLGNNELVLLCDDAPQRRFTPPSWEDQSRNQDIGVEDDLHSCK